MEWNFHWKPKHRHVWIWVSYGGAGWSMYECTGCGEKEIG